MAATDVVSADVVSLAVLRYGTLKAPDGLLGKCEPQPGGWAEAVKGLIRDLRWPEEDGTNVFRGLGHLGILGVLGLLELFSNITKNTNSTNNTNSVISPDFPDGFLQLVEP